MTNQLPAASRGGNAGMVSGSHFLQGASEGMMSHLKKKSYSSLQKTVEPEAKGLLFLYYAETLVESFLIFFL